MFKRQKDGKMVATEHWVNISSFHNLPFLDDRSVVGPPNPKEAHFKHLFGSVQRVEDLLYKNPLMHTVWIKFAGTKIPKWRLWPISYVIFNQHKVASDLCFNFWIEETLPWSPSYSPLSPKMEIKNPDAVNSVHPVTIFLK